VEVWTEEAEEAF
jgi:hypothetical protein